MSIFFLLKNILEFFQVLCHSFEHKIKYLIIIFLKSDIIINLKHQEFLFEIMNAMQRVIFTLYVNHFTFTLSIRSIRPFVITSDNNIEILASETAIFP